MSEPDWRAANLANWDERVEVHLKAPGYDLEPLRTGAGRLNAIEEAELGPVDGKRILHLQCHFGRDTLTLARRGAEVVGLDFSAPAVTVARALAAELGLAGRARFVQADLYDAVAAIPEPAAFDLVYVTWGALNWLPDIVGWARIVAHFLKPGGELYLLEGHPAMLVFDDASPGVDGRPGWFAPYFQREAVVIDSTADYADPDATLRNTRTYEWMHPLGEVLTALLDAGLVVRAFREHDALSWRGFRCLVEGEDGLYRWPDRPWLPLAYSLRAVRPA